MCFEYVWDAGMPVVYNFLLKLNFEFSLWNILLESSVREFEILFRPF